MITTDIVVRFTAEGWHRWPAAPEQRAYLRESHRHMFYVDVTMEVRHHEREVEFHDLLDYARRQFGGGDFGAMSCETMAFELATALRAEFGDRRMGVGVYEDAECGAIVQYTPGELFDA